MHLELVYVLLHLYFKSKWFKNSLIKGAWILNGNSISDFNKIDLVIE